MKSVTELEAEISYLRDELGSLRQLKNAGIDEHYQNSAELNYSATDTSHCFWDWDLTTDCIYLSPTWKNMLGYNEHELDNTVDTWLKITHPEDAANVTEKLHAYIIGENKNYHQDHRMRHKDGHYIFVKTRAIELKRDNNNTPVRLIGMSIDITQQKQAELFDLRNNNIIKMIAQGTPAVNIYEEITHLYESRHKGLMCSILELDGNTLLHGSAPSLPKAYCDNVHRLINGPDVGSCGASTYTGKRVVVESIETDPKWEKIKHIALPYGLRSCWSEPIKSSTGKVLGAFAMYRGYPSVPDELESTALTSAARLASIVMERDNNIKRIEYLAYKDELTGLSSRAHLFLHIKEIIKKSAQYNERFNLLYIDLDNFKSVNDTLGHDVGDYLLQEIASRIVDISRDVNCVARLGGDEFCIVIKDSFNVGIMAQRIIDVVSEPIELSGRRFIPACSVGVARYPDDGIDLKTLLKAADTALYSAKDTGKSCYSFYNVELTHIAEYNFRAEQLLREAIENKELKLVYQPQINFKNGCIAGVEALCRWTHAELGAVSPIEFIAMAEKIGMIKALTEWVIDEACKQTVKWHNAGFLDLRIAINISSTHLSDPDFIPFLTNKMIETGMKPERLELEITESVIQTNHEDFSIFEALKDLGVLLAIDDFGTGYSSFASLKYLKVDYIKIDKHFVNDMLTDKKTHLLIGSMIEMGHNLEYKVIAEGVETKQQFDTLKHLGCDISQGYLFSKPVKPAIISQLLKQTNS